MLVFVQDTFCSDIVVAKWFSIPHSQIRVAYNSSTYALFRNYRELVNWEYIINSHYIFFIFFAVNLTCTNTTMLMVLAPSFVVTAAGLYSNDGTTIDLASINSWFILGLFVSYFFCFITNALNHRSICEMFINRANDCAFVSDTGMLELSHEFMSLSHITLKAMDACCASATESNAQRIRCMMWLLRKQRFLRQSTRPVALHTLGPRNASLTRGVSIRKILSEEIAFTDSSNAPQNLGDSLIWFSSVCKMFQCELDTIFEISDSDDLNVSCVEVDLRHFVCSFVLNVLTKAVQRVPLEETSPLKICIIISVCDAVTLDRNLTSKSNTSSDVSVGSSVVSPKLHTTRSLHQVCPVLFVDPGSQYVQCFAKLQNASPALVSSCDQSPMIASVVDSDEIALLEFVTRLHGSLLIPPHRSPNSDNMLGAFALPCSLTAFSVAHDSVEALPLRLLIIDDVAAFAAHLVANIKRLPSSSNYVIHVESNVADALSKFSNAEPKAIDRIHSGNLFRTYDVVFIDRFMPMERGAATDSEAGVFATFDFW
jgi:hypothetical protein